MHTHSSHFAVFCCGFIAVDFTIYWTGAGVILTMPLLLCQWSSPEVYGWINRTNQLKLIVQFWCNNISVYFIGYTVKTLSRHAWNRLCRQRSSFVRVSLAVSQIWFNTPSIEPLYSWRIPLIKALGSPLKQATYHTTHKAVHSLPRMAVDSTMKHIHEMWNSVIFSVTCSL